jgi:hypothetical protein
MQHAAVSDGGTIPHNINPDNRQEARDSETVRTCNELAYNTLSIAIRIVEPSVSAPVGPPVEHKRNGHNALITK